MPRGILAPLTATTDPKPGCCRVVPHEVAHLSRFVYDNLFYLSGVSKSVNFFRLSLVVPLVACVCAFSFVVLFSHGLRLLSAHWQRTSQGLAALRSPSGDPLPCVTMRREEGKAKSAPCSSSVTRSHFRRRYYAIIRPSPQRGDICPLLVPTSLSAPLYLQLRRSSAPPLPLGEGAGGEWVTVFFLEQKKERPEHSGRSGLQCRRK